MYEWNIVLILYKNFWAILKGLSMWAREYLNVVVLFVNDKIIFGYYKE